MASPAARKRSQRVRRGGANEANPAIGADPTTLSAPNDRRRKANKRSNEAIASDSCPEFAKRSHDYADEGVWDDCGDLVDRWESKDRIVHDN
jgi:hypothetical protein